MDELIVGEAVMHNFFLPDENNLKQVIRQTLSDSDNMVNATTIQTGWTNITMDVHGEENDYIFRFPRNLFFARMMIKDCIFCQFLHKNISFPIPEMSLKFSQNRPFSMHKKIKGVSLTSQLDNLSLNEQEIIANDIAQFLSEIHAIPASKMPINIKQSLSNFLDGLASVHKGNYDFSKHDPLRKIEAEAKPSVIVHGDFNSGNILLNEGRVSGIIDFSFASVSDKHSDLGRFAGRSNSSLSSAVIEAYQNKTKQLCDLQKITDVVNVFKYVECKYVEYMQSSHPEIKIPLSVLQMAAQERLVLA